LIREIDVQKYRAELRRRLAAKRSRKDARRNREALRLTGADSSRILWAATENIAPVNRDESAPVIRSTYNIPVHPVSGFPVCLDSSIPERNSEDGRRDQ
jgi:hypothetical protein